ncbi:MAG: Ycf48-like protein precursor [Pseudomonas sp.]|nr:Ycf48-like protein precursor [Pseudomonas sp.]
MKIILFTRWLFVMCLLGGGGLACADEPVPGTPGLKNVGDTLHQRSLTSALAQRSMLSAITQAGERLIAVGVRGHIVYSDDQGQSWQQAHAPVSVTLTGVCFADSNTGWAVGHRGVILKSDDAGKSWVTQLDGIKAAQAILQARDVKDAAGLQGARNLVADGADKPFLDIQCFDKDHALVVGAYGLGFSTADGGRSWSPSLALLDGSAQRHINVVRTLHDRVYLAGEQGGLYRLSKDARDFKSLGEPYAGSFFGLVASPKDSLLAFGLRGHLFRSTDAGTTWKRVHLDTHQSLTAGTTLVDGSILLVDESGLGWLSRDDGQSFSRVLPTNQFPFLAVQASAQGGAIAVGMNGISFFTPNTLSLSR